MAAAAKSQQKVSSYPSQQSHIIGTCLIVVGALSIVFNIIDIGMTLDLENYSDVSGLQSLGYIGHGIWCGTVFILTGCCGVGARGQRRSKIVLLTVLSVFGAIFAVIQFGISVAGAVLSANKGQDNYGCSTGSINPVCGSVRTLIAMEALLCVLAIGAFVLSIWATVIGCCGCRAHESSAVVQSRNLPSSFNQRPMSDESDEPMTFSSLEQQ
jgi:hypothetical protein